MKPEGLLAAAALCAGIFSHGADTRAAWADCLPDRMCLFDEPNGSDLIQPTVPDCGSVDYRRYGRDDRAESAWNRTAHTAALYDDDRPGLVYRVAPGSRVLLAGSAANAVDRVVVQCR